MAEDKSYILIVYHPAVRNYLGFGAHLELVFGRFALVAVPRRRARWQLGRLASGGYVVPPGLFEDREEALAAIKKMVEDDGPSHAQDGEGNAGRVNESRGPVRPRPHAEQ